MAIACTTPSLRTSLSQAHTYFIRPAAWPLAAPPAALWGVTMTLHKLSAGTGYEYLTRQVAALDSTEKGSLPLADYTRRRASHRGDGQDRVSSGSTGSKPARWSPQSR